MLTGANQQIITAFEELGMTPEEMSLSSDDGGFGYDITAIKATLMQFSSKYREAMKVEPSLDFTIDEQREAKDALVRLMRTSEDEWLISRVAQSIRDDGKGRKDIAKSLNGINVNVNYINQIILQGQQAKLRDKNPTLAKTSVESNNNISENSNQHLLVEAELVK